MNKSFTLTPALALAHAGPTLALHPGAIGKAFALMGEDSAIGEVTPATGRVAVLHIRGPLSQRTTAHMCGISLGYDTIAAGFARLLADPQVGAVVLAIDSPGGDVAGLFSAVERMRSVRADSSKPVFAFADELCCSAAYAIACVANAGIFLPSSGELGSVGVLSIHCDESGAQEGRTFTVFRSGSRKAEGNPLEPLTDVARLSFQARIDDLAAQFFELVATSRGLSPEQVKALEGASFLGREAVAVGLANGVATLDQVLVLAASAAVGVPMTDEEKSEMDSLKARLAAAEEKLAALEGDEEETPADDAPADEAPSEDMPADEEEDSAKAEIARLRAELAKRDIQAAVDAASRQGKVEPAKRAAMVALGEQIGLDGLKVVLDALPAHAITRGPKSPTGSGSANAAALTALELTVAKQMGQSPEAYAKEKARIAATRDVA